MKKKPRRSPAAVFFGGIFYCAFLVLVLCVGTFFGWIGRSPLLKEAFFHPSAFLNSNPKQTFHQDSLNVLVLGCDEDRWYHGVKLHGSNIIRKYARSDMMMVARLDFDNNQITALSIPRDTKCKLPGFP